MTAALEKRDTAVILNTSRGSQEATGQSGIRAYAASAQHAAKSSECRTTNATSLTLPSAIPACRF
jgi:hypothetical protein